MSGYEPSLRETANDVFDGIEGLGAVAGAGGDHRPRHIPGDHAVRPRGPGLRRGQDPRHVLPNHHAHHQHYTDLRVAAMTPDLDPAKGAESLEADNSTQGTSDARSQDL